MSTAAERIASEVTSWEGVTSAPHRFNGVAFNLGRRELGHVHGDQLADLPFPRRVRDELIAAGQASEHHWMPDSGWVSRRIQTDEDVADVIALFRLSYDRAAEAVDRRAGARA